MKCVVVKNTQNMARRFGEDMVANAYASCLRDAGHEVAILDRVEAENAEADLWIFVCSAKAVYGMPPRKGFRILLNAERVDYSCLPCIREYGHIGLKIRIRSVDLSDHVSITSAHHDAIMDCIDTDRVDAIFDYNPHNDEFWKLRGVSSLFVPLGYHEAFRVKRRGNVDRVLLLGLMTDHRRAKIARINGRMSFIEKSSDRDYLLGSHRIGVNIHQVDGYSVFADRRMAMYGSNRYVIVSEPCDWIPVDADWVETGAVVRNCRRALIGKFKPSIFYHTCLRMEGYVNESVRIAMS